jgi:hypothetical protein
VRFRTKSIIPQALLAAGLKVRAEGQTYPERPAILARQSKKANASIEKTAFWHA